MKGKGKGLGREVKGEAGIRNEKGKKMDGSETE